MWGGWVRHAEGESGGREKTRAHTERGWATDARPPSPLRGRRRAARRRERDWEGRRPAVSAFPARGEGRKGAQLTPSRDALAVIVVRNLWKPHLFRGLNFTLLNLRLPKYGVVRRLSRYCGFEQFDFDAVGFKNCAYGS
ncbi:MAG: hypothetical protein ACKERG_04570 [Candidatus Hodgkinia cicadicola]